tara:strand:+ start:456 stop:866 length:411 start_codon:yes stop_codon:yes gene_type:complete
MRFESEVDLSREQKAIKTFVNTFQGSFKKLDPNDIDFRVFDKNGDMIAYAEVKGRLKKYKDAFPLPVAARKLVKLADKRLNPVMIWACDDGIVYAKVNQISGTIRWGGRLPRKGSYNDQELMIYFNSTSSFKYISY